MADDLAHPSEWVKGTAFFVEKLEINRSLVHKDARQRFRLECRYFCGGRTEHNIIFNFCRCHHHPHNTCVVASFNSIGESRFCVLIQHKGPDCLFDNNQKLLG